MFIVWTTPYVLIDTGVSLLSFSENTPLINIFSNSLGAPPLRREIFGAVAHNGYTWYDISTYTITDHRRNVCSKASDFFFKEENYLNRTKPIRKSPILYTVASQRKQNRPYFV